MNSVGERFRSNPNLTEEGYLKLRIKIRREELSPYLTFEDIDSVGRRLDDPGGVLYRLRDVVDLRYGAHDEVIGYLEYDQDLGQVVGIDVRDGYRSTSGAVDLEEFLQEGQP